MTVGLAAQPTGPLGVPTAEISRRLEAAGVPRRFRDCRLATFEPRRGTGRALEAATVLATDGDGRGLVLSGPPGTGKTHLAVAIVAGRLEAWLSEWPEPIRETTISSSTLAPDGPYPTGSTRIVARPNLALRFLVVPTFLDRLRAAARWADREDPLPELFSVDLLVLDDLGREKVTDWATERLYVLINERYNACLPTVVTTNYTAGELAARGYDALVSRLMEGADLVGIAASDFRLRRSS